MVHHILFYQILATAIGSFGMGQQLAEIFNTVSGRNNKSQQEVSPEVVKGDKIQYQLNKPKRKKNARSKKRRRFKK